MPASPLANRIVEALNSNEGGPAATALPHDEDIVVGPLVFRYGGGPQRDRWYVAEDPAIGICERLGGHDYQDHPSDPDLQQCSRLECGYTYNAKYWGKQ